MKHFVILSFTFLSITLFGQKEPKVEALERDSSQISEPVVNDTIELYVINNTNSFVAIQSSVKTEYAFFYRDLKFLRTQRELNFKNAESLEKFFTICDKALATDKTHITQGYNISRNRLNKNVLRLNNKQGGYTLMKRETLEFLKEAYKKHNE